jgi:hypothetical protein
MRRASFAACLLLVFPALSQQGIRVKNGFLTANEFMHMNGQSQSDYSMGVVDGMLLAPLFGAPREWNEGEKIGPLGDCITGMSSGQVAAIISNFVRDHPERWNEPMHTAAFTAMTRACSRK